MTPITAALAVRNACATARSSNSNHGNRKRFSRRILFLFLAVLGSSASRLAMAKGVRNKVQQRNSYLDLWSNVFDVLDTSAIDAEVVTLEEHVESIDSTGTRDSEGLTESEDSTAFDKSAGSHTEDKSKHRLMDILESRRKERRSNSLMNVMSTSYGRVFGGGGGLSGGSGVGVGGGPGGLGDLATSARSPRTTSKFRQLGIPVDAGSFESKICFKMQNLGNADKYHGIVAGSPGCEENDQSHDTVSAMMTWKGESMFTIDCSIASFVNNATDGSSIQSIRAALTKSGHSSDDVPLSHELSVTSHATCSLFVVSEIIETVDGDAGHVNASLHANKPSAAVLRLTDVPLPTDHAIDMVPLNAIKIKLCNLPSAWSIGSEQEYTPESADLTDESQQSSLTLPTLKLNGKRVTSKVLSSEAGSTCLTHTYRVPSVGLSGDGFVLSGSMLVNEASTKLGAGRASAVEIQFGSVGIIEN